MDRLMTRPTTGPKTRGTALPTALLVLVVLTLLGTAAVFTAGTELDIAGNNRRELQALSVAEAGVHEALARLNMRTGAAPNRIIPGDNPPGSGTPDPNWSVTIVSGTPSASQVQTLTASADPATVLPVSARIQYKREAAEQPVQHCNADGCTNEVVHFHTGFGYSGTNVPNGGAPTSGPPVLQLVSTFTGAGAAKTLTVEATRVATTFNFPATVRACGDARDKDTAIVNGSTTPPKPAIIAGGVVELIPPAQANGGIQQGDPTVACSTTLFRDTFGMSMTDMIAIADNVGFTNTTPVGLKGKIIYVPGDAVWEQPGAVIGSATEPVIVIVNGKFEMRKDVTVYGVIYVQGDQFKIRENAVLNGAVVIQGNGPPPSGERNAEIKDSARVNYDPNVINSLANFSPFAVIVWKAN